MDEVKKIGGLTVRKVVTTFGDGKQKVLFTNGACAVVDNDKILYNTPILPEQMREIEREEDLIKTTNILREVIREEFETFKRELREEQKV